MANRVEGFDEKILQCAKKEFLEKGFTEASLRTISQNAGVSTSTIYTRYTDKEGLFRFIVDPVAEGFKNLLTQSLYDFSSLPKSEQGKKMKDYADKGFSSVLSFVFSHFEEFRLLVTCGPDNSYQDFLESIVEIDSSYMKNYLIQIKSKALRTGRITDGFLHVVSSGFYSGLFEVVIHNMPYEEAKNYLKELRIFYNDGWKGYMKN